MKKYTASEMHTKSKVIFRKAVKTPVLINHDFHGEFVLMSIDEFNKMVSSNFKNEVTEKE